MLEKSADRLHSHKQAFGERFRLQALDLHEAPYIGSDYRHNIRFLFLPNPIRNGQTGNEA